MHKKLRNLNRTLKLSAIPVIVKRLLRDEAISGKLIIATSLLALLFVNSPLSEHYETFWNLNLSIGLGSWLLTLDLRHWVNDGLMTVFFLMVGLELKREVVHGELKKFKTAILPIAAAIGGMIVPALFYWTLNNNTDNVRGWAIPTATDIAFAVGLLALLGRRVPSSLRLFILTLAIVDDIGAILVITLFYGTDLNLIASSVAMALVLGTSVLAKKNLLTMPVFILTSIMLWLAIEGSGIHPSIAGLILGFLAPLGAREVARRSVAERLENVTIPLVTLFIVPLFVFANAGVPLILESFSSQTMTVVWGIFTGLVAGKVVGILSASWLLVKFKIADLPKGANWAHMTGLGLLAGVGFTVSVFITDLAFGDDASIQDAAKLGIFAASAASGLLGFVVLRYMSKRRRGDVS